MRCYKCGSLLTSSDYCLNCGADVVFFKKIVGMSNYYYNIGLERAGVHDLTGAESALLRSLKYHKRNVSARNLLGLVYYEEGRLGEALAEWIVSANILPQDNPAARYIAEIQNDKTQADVMNKQIRHFNESLAFLSSGSEDLAFLQLKKLIAEDTKIIDVYLLMAALCMKNGNESTARQCLKKALRLDRGCFRAVKYLNDMKERHAGGAQSVPRSTGPIRQPQEGTGQVSYTSGNETIIQPAAPSARELSAAQSAIRFGIGFLCGAAIIGFLVLPAKLQKVRSESSQSTATYGDDITSKDAQIEELNQELAAAQQAQTTAEAAAQQAQAASDAYEKLLEYREQYRNEEYDSIEIAQFLSGLDRNALGARGQEIYDYLRENVFDTATNRAYNKGVESLDNGDYATAVTQLEQLVSLDSGYNGGEGLFLLAKAYAGAGRAQDASAAYDRIINEQPDSSYASEAQTAKEQLPAGN